MLLLLPHSWLMGLVTPMADNFSVMFTSNNLPGNHCIDLTRTIYQEQGKFYPICVAPLATQILPRFFFQCRRRFL